MTGPPGRHRPYRDDDAVRPSRSWLWMASRGRVGVEPGSEPGTEPVTARSALKLRMALAAFGLVACLAGVAFGIHVMTQK